MKIYISSTFTDLREHRAAVVNVLRKLGHDVISMESYFAESSRPVDVCQEDSSSCDVYILILGWRYGYVPQDQGSSEPVKSITELEYESALSSQRDILPFLLNAEAAWPAQLMDAITKEQDSSRIEAFRNRVSRAHMVSTFSSPDELAREVAAAIKRVEASARLSERALRTADRAQFAVMSAEGEMTDTTVLTIANAISENIDAEVVTIEVGNGNMWWSTRLFLLASLAADLTSIRQFLFTGKDYSVIGLTTPTIVRDRLRSEFPELLKYEHELGNDSLMDTVDEVTRRLDLWYSFFSESPSKSGSSKKTKKSIEEVDVRVWVRNGLIKKWLGEYLIQGGISIDRKAGLTLTQVQQILDWPWPYIPVQGLASVEEEEEFPIVVNRDAFALELAREWVAREMPRTPSF